MKVIVYFDYVCPYCLLAEVVISKAAPDGGVEIDWRPFELRPAPIPTLRPEDPYLPTVWRHSVYPLASKLEVPIKLPTISPQPRSTKAFELFCLARERGVGDAYNMAVFKAFFQQDVDIGDPANLGYIAASVGLDQAEALAALEDGRYSEQHHAALDHAREQNIHSVPTIVVGDRVFHGVPGVTAMVAALRESHTTSERG